MSVVTYTSTDLGSAEADSAYEEALVRAAASFPAAIRGVVGGEEVPGVRVVRDFYPGDTSVLVAQVEEASPEVVDRAVSAARAAFGTWGRVGWEERAAALHRVAGRIERDRLEIAAVVAWETGKVRTEAVGEVDESAVLLDYYAGCLEEEKGYVIPMGRGAERVESVLRPWGVWGVVSPFNFPFAAAAGMTAGALLGGNTVVFKPSSNTAWSGRLLYEALAAELPQGVVQLVVGSGPEVGAAMMRHPGIDGFVFTGSRRVGLAGVAEFSRRRARPFIAEMGGKNPVLVMPSADLDSAVSGIVQSAFRFSGQKCSAASRVYAHRRVHDALVERLIAATDALEVADPHRRTTFTGPVIDERAVSRFRQAADAASGLVVAGGRVLQDGPLAAGLYVQPTVVAGLPLDHPHYKEELFLPFLAVAAVDDLDQALSEANGVPFGLTAGIFSDDPGEVDRFFDEIEAGSVYANRTAGATAGAWPGIQAFGGWKDSGSSGRHALGPRYVPQFMREQSRTLVMGEGGS